MIRQRVAIVDYGMCNLDSVARAVEECGGEPLVTDDPRDLDHASRIILPGVGAFPQAMQALENRGLVEALRHHVVEDGVPFLGVCLGMQLMATRSFEVEETPGLRWIDADVERLEPADREERVPHIGWNEVNVVADSPLFADLPSGGSFYFVHSFHLRPRTDGCTVATTPFAGGFVAAVQQGSMYGVQFHPEKSQKLGFRVLRNFLCL